MGAMVTRKPEIRAMACCGLIAFAGPSLAHHSAAMFDPLHQITLIGTVAAFRWSDPHCSIELTAMDHGVPVEWRIEMGGTLNLDRDGWRRDSLRDGDRLTVTINSSRDGSHNGQFVSALGMAGAPIGIAL